MKQKFLVNLAILLVSVCVISAANADMMTVSILDIGDFVTYTNTDTTATYAGTGFVGMYSNTLGNTPAFVHLFGLESVDFSRTLLQADIGSLSGASINSAYLEFLLTDGSTNSQDVLFSSFDATGTLGYLWDVTALDSVTASITGLSANSVDVTGMLATRVAAGEDWFGLHLQGTGEFQWSYTYSGYGDNADSAQVRLVVDYDPIPEPSTMLLLGFGLVGLAGVVRKKMKK